VNIIKQVISLTLAMVLLLESQVYAIVNPSFNAEFHMGLTNTINENSSNQSRGQLLNATYYSRGDLSSVDFDGLCDYQNFETSNSGAVFNVTAELLGGVGLSTSMWVKSSSMVSASTLLEIVDAQNVRLVTISTESTSSGSETKGLSFYIKNKSDNTVRRYISDYRVFENSKWMHIATSFSSTTGELFIYVNGLKYSKSILSVGDFSYESDRVYLGRNQDGSSGLIGAMDEVKIFNSELTQEEISNIYKNEKKYNNFNGDTRECLDKTCTLTTIRKTSPIADIFGKSVFTKKTFVYDCVYVSNKRGACRTENKNITYEIPQSDFNATYIDTIQGGNLQEIATIASAQSFSNKIMSGWKGYCLTGLDEDYSWAEDPYFWASIALSLIMGSIGGGDTVAGAASDTATKETTKLTTEQATKEAIKKTVWGAQQAAKEAAKKKLYESMANYATCAVQAGLDLGAMEEASKDDIGCDPVDQICESEDMSYDSQIYSITKTEYNDMLASNPEYADFMDIISEDDDMVQFYIVYQGTDDSATQKEIDEALKEQKEKMKNIQQTVVAITALACLGSVALGGTSNTSSTSGGGDDGVSTADIGTAIVSAAATAICGPVCGAAVQVFSKFAQSYKEIDTCSSEEDAEEKGTRHSATLKAKRMGLCKLIRKDCAIQDKVDSESCQLDSYYYCCYDTVLTKVLAEQVKAQLGLSWAHCTGISLNEFMNIGFQGCEDTTRTDGTMLEYDASLQERQSAFQYTDKCIDYTEYINYIKGITNGRFNEDDLQDLFSDKVNVKQCTY